MTHLLQERAAPLLRRASPSPVKARNDAARAAELADRLLLAGLADDARAARLLQAEALIDAREHAAASAAVTAASHEHRSRVEAPLAIRLHTRLVSGRIDLATGNRGAGLAEIRRGLNDLADFQARFGSQDLQSG